MQEITKHMGVTYELRPLPASRAAILLERGEIHADLSRIAEFQEEVPTAVRVAEPFLQIPYYAYAKNLDLTVQGWESLKPYRLVTLRGFHIASVFLREHQTQFVDSTESALDFLMAGRADIFSMISTQVDSLLKLEKYQISGIKKLQPPIMVMDTYTYFSKKHSSYAPPYEEALVQVKKSGLYEKLAAMAAAE